MRPPGADAGDATADISPGNDSDSPRDADDGGVPAWIRDERTWGVIQHMSPADKLVAPDKPTNDYVDDPQAVKLGHFLFYEKKLSGTGQISCASCHPPDHGFSGEKPHSIGAGGSASPTPHHAPTLLNVAFSKWYFWDGRRDSLWSQAIVPYENPIEMGGTRLKLADYVYSHSRVRQAYEAIFGPLPKRSTIDPFPTNGRPFDEPNTQSQVQLDEAWNTMSGDDQEQINRIMVNVMKSVAAFETQLVSVDAPFDRFVTQVRRYPERPGKWDAISPRARRGLKLFVGAAGCKHCHSGPMLSDQQFHNIGLPKRSWVDDQDLGRWKAVELLKNTPFNAAGPYSDAPDGQLANLVEVLPQVPPDKGAFKTPTLRNVARTPPYMDAGHFDTLQKVLEFYNDPPDDRPVVGGRDQDVRPLQLTDAQLRALKAFLNTLSGQPTPQSYKRQPATPLVK